MVHGLVLIKSSDDDLTAMAEKVRQTPILLRYNQMENKNLQKVGVDRYLKELDR